MLNIGIDARFAVQKRRGIGNYTYHLLHYLAELDHDNTYFLYTDREDVEKALPNQGNFHVRQLSPANYFLWEQFALARQVLRDRIDVLHCTGNTAPFRLPPNSRLVVTIHDVMYLKNTHVIPSSQSLYQRLGRVYRKLNVPVVARQAAQTITVSTFSKQDILSQLPHLPDERVIVIPEAANEIFKAIPRSDVEAALGRLGIREGFLLTLGGLDPRKNTEFVIRTYLDLREEKALSEQLVVVGLPNWQKTSFYDLIRNSPYSSDVRFTDFLSEDHLVALYNACKVFLYPSRYEGFGMPPLEAMACGAPVITSNVTSIPEIVGDAALLVSPDDPQEFKQAITSLCTDEALRKVLIERGFGQIKKYSWQRMARETRDLYLSLKGKS